MAEGSRVRLWRTMTMAGPLAALVATPVAASLMGGFTEALVGHDVSAATAFGILGTMCLPVGAFFFARMKLDTALALESRSWPTVPGTILSSRTEQRLTEDGTLHSLVLSYTYQAGGRTYRGDLLGFGPDWVPDKELVEELARKYPVGATVAVHVDPDDDEMAVLETTGELADQNGWRVWLCVSVPVLVTAVVAVRNMF